MSDDELSDDELRDLAMLMALTMPPSPEEEALARRVEEKQEQWARIWSQVFREQADA